MPEKVFIEFANLVRQNDDIMFVRNMIETLTMTLCASPLESNLREKIRGIKPTKYCKDRNELFMSLFETWSYNSVSCMTLCLLSGNYELAYNLIPRMSMEILDTHKLIQLGNLVQIIELPTFVHIRIDLMNSSKGKNAFLLKTLQGLLMILPISKSF